MPSRRATAIASGAVVAVLGALHLKRKKSNSAANSPNGSYEMSQNGSSRSAATMDVDADLPSASYQL